MFLGYQDQSQTIGLLFWAWTYFREVFRLGHDLCLILGSVGFVCCFAETRLGHVNWPHPSHHLGKLLPPQQAPPPKYLEPVGIGLDWFTKYPIFNIIKERPKSYII